jgi:periplasmic divalent cation tolerance protein
MTEFCHLWLACESKEEASKIAKTLLDKHLIACAKQLPIISDYWWKGDQEHAEETLLVMESRTDLFDTIDSIVAKLHGYETFSLQAIPLIRISPKAEEWLTKETKQ